VFKIEIACNFIYLIEENNMRKISRRDFFKKTGATALLAGAVTEETQAQQFPKWDEEYDVIVIGSGFAGLSAAVEALDNGAKVAVIEKMPMFGGNSTINGGGFAAVNSSLQKKLGITDSPDLLYADMFKAGLGLNYPKQARMIAEKSGETFEWLQSYIGVKFKDTIAQFGGHSVPRTHTTLTQSGSAIVRPLYETAKAKGAELKKKTKFVKYFLDSNGGVAGISVQTGYNFKDDSYKSVLNIRAKKGVVMASGGFGADVNFRLTQDPRLTVEVDTTNQPGATSECLVEMLSMVEATPVQLSWIQLGPWASPDEKGFGLTPIFSAYASFPNGVMIDPSTGKRFVNELADRKVRADAILKTGHICLTFCDSEGVKPAAHVLDTLIKNKVVYKFDTLAELALHYDVPLKELEAQIKRYNSYVKSKNDQEFQKPFELHNATVEKAPYYCARLWPKVHHCMGGVRITTEAEVINIRTEKPIPGLYAAGESAGGTHGACRLGTCAIPDCVIFGRIAGRNAARRS
jgi:flavocytochrome c